MVTDPVLPQTEGRSEWRRVSVEIEYHAESVAPRAAIEAGLDRLMDHLVRSQDLIVDPSLSVDLTEKHDPYRDPCRCKPEGRCYGLAPYESLCKVFVAEDGGDAGAPSATQEPVGHGWPSRFRLWGYRKAKR